MDGALRAEAPPPGVLLGDRYRVGEVLGQGGMSIVLAAFDERTNAKVAVKVLQALGGTNTDRFFREARFVSTLTSDHVVRVLDLGKFQGVPFLVMERLSGEDFGAKVRAARLPLEEVADCVIQACEALAHAHAAGIVHRDIKASNLFEHQRANGLPIVKVLDFGISKATGGPREPEHTLTRTRDGGFLGSPAYMSPEQIRNPKSVDFRTDLWSLGVVAYRLLSTKFPFEAESTNELLAAILERPIPRLAEHGVQVPEAFEQIVLRCLARDREQRFPTAAAVAEAIAPFASATWRPYGERIQAIPAAASAPSVFDTAPKLGQLVDPPTPEPGTHTVPPPAPAFALTPTGPPPPLPPATHEVTQLLPPGTGPRLPVLERPPSTTPGAPKRARWLAPAIVVGLLGLALGAVAGVRPAALHLGARPPPVSSTTATTPSAVASVDPAPPPSTIASAPSSAPTAPAPTPGTHRGGRPRAPTHKTVTPAAPSAAPPAAPPPAPATSPPRVDLEPNPYPQ